MADTSETKTEDVTVQADDFDSCSESANLLSRIEESLQRSGVVDPPKEFIVGSSDCSFYDIVTTLDPTTSTNLLRQWKDIAWAMGVDAETIERARRNWINEFDPITNVYMELLIKWKSVQSEKATVQALINILEICSCQDVADRLRDKYYKDEYVITLKQRNKRQCRLIIGMAVGIVILISVLAAVLLPMYLKFDPTKIEYRNSVPSTPEGYIVRTLSSRSEMSHDVLFVKRNLRPIFNKSYVSDLSDVVAFTGIETYKLQELVPYGNAVAFKDALGDSSIRCRFIAEVNSLSDFQQLCLLGKEISVHWLEYQNATSSFHWKLSCGEMDYVQMAIKLENQKICNETCMQMLPFFTNTISQVKSNLLFRQPIIIFGGSGTGKRTLLAKIGNTFINASNIKVVFTEFAPFLAKVVQLQTREISLKETIVKVVVDIACKNELCKEFLQPKINSSHIKLLLLFNAFEEITDEYVESGQNVLKEIASWSSTLMIITTQPSSLLLLENALKTMAFSLEPFSHAEQIDYLVNFWYKNDPSMGRDQLRNVAEVTVHKISSQLSLKDHNVTGIALLTALVAEVHQKKVMREVNMLQTELEKLIKSENISIQQIFKDFVSIRLQNAFNDTFVRKKIEEFLGLEAIHQKFPSLILPNCSYLFSDIQKTGLIDKRDDGEDLDKIRFLHATFIDYFVARYILICNNTNTFCLNVYKEGFRVEPVYLNYQNNLTAFKSVSYTFTNDLVTYFLENTSFSYNFAKGCHGLPGENFEVYLAMVHDDLHTLFVRLYDCTWFPVDTLKRFLVLAVTSSGTELVKFIAQKYDERQPVTNITVDCYDTLIGFCNLLELAALRGHSEIFQFLYTAYFSSENLGTYVVHNAVTESFQGKSKVIETNKVDIINFLVKRFGRGSAFFEQAGEICTPMFYAHTSNILHNLLDNGVNASTKCNGKGTILHYSIVIFSPEELYSIMVNLDNLNFLTPDMVNYAFNVTQSALVTYVSEMEQDTKILELFKKAKANFSGILNPFCQAIFHGRSLKSLQFLQSYVPSWNECGSSNSSSFFYSVECNHVTAANLTFQYNPEIINMKNMSRGFTPLYFIFNEFYATSANGTITPMINLLLTSNANPNSLNGELNSTPFMVALKTASLAVVKTLVSHNACVPCKDNEMNTALFYALNPYNRLYDEYNLVKFLVIEHNVPVNAVNIENKTAFKQQVVDDQWKNGLTLNTIIFMAINDAVDTKLANIVVYKILERCYWRYDTDQNFNNTMATLERHGANLHSVNEHSQTFLHISVINTCVSGVTYFIEYGLGVNEKDGYGQTPLFYANMSSEEGTLIREILVDHKAHL